MIHCNEYKQGTQWKSYTALSVVCFPSNSMFYKPVDFGLLGKVPENHMQLVAFRGWEGLLGQALPGLIYQGASWRSDTSNPHPRPTSFLHGPWCTMNGPERDRQHVRLAGRPGSVFPTWPFDV